ncbi:cyclic AMP-dependent transcription factor ATF-3 [Festucalex cinctus]
MLHNSRPTLADVSCSSPLPRPSPLPRLSPPGSLSLDDLSHLTGEREFEREFEPEPGRAGRADLSSDGASSCSDLGGKTQLSLTESDRRKRRRENNKAAAAKCRKKKKDRTEYLMLESEKLESVNVTLKAQIKALNQQKQHLSYMLNQHRPTCIVRTPDHETADLFARHLQDSPSSIFAAAAAVAPELDAGGLLGLDHVECSVSM